MSADVELKDASSNICQFVQEATRAKKAPKLQMKAHCCGHSIEISGAKKQGRLTISWFAPEPFSATLLAEDERPVLLWGQPSQAWGKLILTANSEPANHCSWINSANEALVQWFSWINSPDGLSRLSDLWPGKKITAQPMIWGLQVGGKVYITEELLVRFFPCDASPHSIWLFREHNTMSSPPRARFEMLIDCAKQLVVKDPNPLFSLWEQKLGGLSWKDKWIWFGKDFCLHEGVQAGVNKGVKIDSGHLLSSGIRVVGKSIPEPHHLQHPFALHELGDSLIVEILKLSSWLTETHSVCCCTTC